MDRDLKNNPKIMLTFPGFNVRVKIRVIYKKNKLKLTFWMKLLPSPRVTR